MTSEEIVQDDEKITDETDPTSVEKVEEVIEVITDDEVIEDDEVVGNAIIHPKLNINDKEHEAKLLKEVFPHVWKMKYGDKTDAT